MKKNKMYFETNFWAVYEAEDPLEALYSFFDFAHLDYYKQMLSDVVMHCHKSKIYKQDNPCEIFVFYTAVCSFIKVCYCLKRKSIKWKVKSSGDYQSITQLASLSKEEYANPFLVFQSAFEEKTPEEFIFFLYEIVQISLSPHTEELDYDLVTCYIHLIRMLDAGQIMGERGIEKIEKAEEIIPVTE
ncbi:hypothetical protein ACFFVK_12750 [Flavobacterium gyeonganense]|uniref:Uncharacterized protein n=1 Tax=Flavobacterium gyeonganense TaxID=1310418 RepID=A0ABV5HC23_9FLAO